MEGYVLASHVQLHHCLDGGTSRLVALSDGLRAQKTGLFTGIPKRDFVSKERMWKVPI
jgi:hypothetical protein